MSSKYEARLKALEEIKCNPCGGSGQINDAELGDICYGTSTCHGCNGSGVALHSKPDPIRELIKNLTDPSQEFYIKEKPVGKKPGLMLNIVELIQKIEKSIEDAI